MILLVPYKTPLVVSVAAVPHSGIRPGAVWERAAAAVVTAAGKVTGRVLRAVPTVPGLAGAAMVAYGAAMIYRPAGVIAGGAFLLLLDRRL